MIQSLIFLILVGLDQYTKYLAETYLKTKSLPFLEYSQNTGIAFGIPIPKPLLLILIIGLIPLIIYIAKTEMDLKKKLPQAILILILAGAIGNLIDRLTRGYVVDFISIGPWPNFNLADTYITIAVLLAVVFHGKITGNKNKNELKRDRTRNRSK